MDANPQPAAGNHATPEELRRTIGARFAVRFHVALILAACFAVGLGVTKLLLMAGVGTMWIRYAVALGLAYCAFLLGVRIWLRYAGFDRRILPSRRRNVLDDGGLLDFGGPGGGGGKSVDLPVFRGVGGGSGGGGASAHFGGGGALAGDTSPSSALAVPSPGHSSSGGSGFSLDFGDDGWVLLALIALVAALFGAVVWTIYVAPTILADAAFAGMLSAGLVRSTRRMDAGGWMGSVVGHTWLAFTAVFVLAVVFALVAQNQFPEARTLADVVRRL